MNVRALFQAVTVPGVAAPYNTIHLKVVYPARSSGSESEQNMGVVPADSQQAPFKIVILFNGINCGAELYQWLAIRLAERGLVVVTFSWVAENLPGFVALTPGVDIEMLMPQRYGTGPTASALPSLLVALDRLQQTGVLAGLLDLDQIVVGGHSAGGRVAIESASPAFFPAVKAAFAYGAHTAAAVQMGYEAGKVLSLPDALPLLLMGGTCDGVIAQSSHRYGVSWDETTTPVQRTFAEAIAGGRGDCYLLLLEGANHFAIADPLDATTGRPFLDFPATQSADQLRDLMAQIIELFIEAHVCSQPTARQELDRLLNTPHPLIAQFERK